MEAFTITIYQYYDWHFKDNHGIFMESNKDCTIGYEWDINGILMILFLPRIIRWRNQDYHDCHDYMYDYNIL